MVVVPPDELEKPLEFRGVGLRVTLQGLANNP